MEHTWQTELIKELKDVIKGYEEAQSVIPGVTALAEKLTKETELKTEDIAKELIDLKLGWFASKVLNGSYEQQAQMEQQVQQPPIVPEPLEKTDEQADDQKS